MQLTRHAQDKLATYGIEGDRLVSWRSALSGAEPFLDASTGARGLLMEWEGRPWVVILREDGGAVVTTSEWPLFATKIKAVDPTFERG